MFVERALSGEVASLLTGEPLDEQTHQATVSAMVEAIRQYVALAVRNEKLVARLERVAQVDALTGLINHSSLLRAIDARLAELDGTLGIVLLDISNFGRINDVYGARVGDRVLDTVAERLSTLADEDTLVARFGGDDFALLARRPGREAIAALVDAACACTAGLAFRGDDRAIPIRLNCGYASAPDEAATRHDLLALAELRLKLSVERGGSPVGAPLAPLERYGSFGTVDPLVECVLLHDPYTRMHLLHVNHLAQRWAPQLGLDRTRHETFVRAALLHDIGKMLVPQAILLKPAKLEPGEYAAIQRHAEYGRALLCGYDGFGDVARVIGQHHERWDGGGYPHGVRGPRIDRLARAISVIDAFSAMTLDRPYHRGVAPPDALEELERCSGTQFEPQMVRSFVELTRAA